MAYRATNAGVLAGLGGTPSPPLQKIFFADFRGTPTLRGKTHQTVFDRFLCECSFTPQVFENAEKLLMLQRKVRGWFDSDIGMKLTLRG